MKGEIRLNFNFEEAELINSMFEESEAIQTKESIIYRMTEAQNNTDEPELVAISQSAINKIQALDDDTIQRLMKSLPIDHELIV